MLTQFKSFQKAAEIYHKCESLQFPEPLRDQLLRASSSVALNLAEGWGKISTKDRERSFAIALASLRECQGVLYLRFPAAHVDLLQEMDELAAMIFTLCTKPRPKQKG
jgi:four helix bundle protein